MKEVKSRTGETELQPPEYVPAGPARPMGPRELAIRKMGHDMIVLAEALEQIEQNAGCLVGGAMCSPLCPGCIARKALRKGVWGLR